MIAVKTSQTHPLEIGTIELPETGGRIGLTLCPGKKQLHAMNGSWDRDLPTDFKAIEDWGARVIINLIEDHEMVALQVEDTVRYLPERACYLHLPIPDLGVPGREWEANWGAVSPALLRCLQQGQSSAKVAGSPP